MELKRLTYFNGVSSALKCPIEIVILWNWLHTSVPTPFSTVCSDIERGFLQWYWKGGFQPKEGWPSLNKHRKEGTPANQEKKLQLANSVGKYYLKGGKCKKQVSEQKRTELMLVLNTEWNFKQWIIHNFISQMKSL